MMARVSKICFQLFQGLTLVNHLVDSWNLNRAIWERHSELVNVEETPNSASHAYKVVFYPVCKAKRYIQVCEKNF